MVKANKNKEKLADIYTTVFKSFSLIFTPFCIYIAFHSKDLVVLILGKQWADMSMFFSVIILSYLCIPLGSVSLNIIKAVGDSALFLKLELIKKVIILSTAIIAINIGFNALIFSIMLAYLINLFVDINGVRRHIYVPVLSICLYQFITLFFSVTSLLIIEFIYPGANNTVLGFLFALTTYIFLYAAKIFIVDRKTVRKLFAFYI
ncbi:oligosaccharide flippase family protein [Vibrio chagasii]|uniref:oligosaccharide flippase family protein n=1 Tax=Vibrio chagasii TaxID=170679 RepID=UPI0038CD3E9B